MSFLYVFRIYWECLCDWVVFMVLCHVPLSSHSLNLQVVGAGEEERQTVNVRTRDNVVHGEKSWDEIDAQLQAFKVQHTHCSFFLCTSRRH